MIPSETASFTFEQSLSTFQQICNGSSKSNLNKSGNDEKKDSTTSPQQDLKSFLVESQLWQEELFQELMKGNIKTKGDLSRLDIADYKRLMSKIEVNFSNVLSKFEHVYEKLTGYDVNSIVISSGDDDKNVELRKWLRGNNIWQNELYNALLSHNIETPQEVQQLDKNSLNSILENARFRYYSKHSGMTNGQNGRQRQTISSNAMDKYSIRRDNEIKWLEHNLKDEFRHYMQDWISAKQFINNASGIKESGEKLLDVLSTSILINIRECKPIVPSLMFIAAIYKEAEFIDTIVSTFHICLTHDKIKDPSVIYRLQWLRQHFVLESNILSMPIRSPKYLNKYSDSGRLTLYDIVWNEILKPRYNQLKLFYLKDQLNDEIHSNNHKNLDVWRELKKFGIFHNLAENGEIRQTEMKGIETGMDLLQGKGLKLLHENRFDLFQLEKNKATSNRRVVTEDLLIELEDENSSGFEMSREYEESIVLTDLLIRSHMVNSDFQKECASIFNQDFLGVPCLFREGPVKAKDRASRKAVMDYFDKKWPHCIHITDFVRCSVTFEHLTQLYTAVTKFRQLVRNSYHMNVAKNRKKEENKENEANNKEKNDKTEKSGAEAGKAEKTEKSEKSAKKDEAPKAKKNQDEQQDTEGPATLKVIKRIVKISNGFSKISDDIDSLDNLRYCDVKFLVIAECHGVAIVAEIQFLAQIMLNFKKKCHSVYELMRLEPVYYRLAKMIEQSMKQFGVFDNDDKNGNNMKQTKMLQLCKHKAFRNLKELILWQDWSNINLNEWNDKYLNQLSSYCDQLSFKKGKKLCLDFVNHMKRVENGTLENYKKEVCDSKEEEKSSSSDDVATRSRAKAKAAGDEKTDDSNVKFDPIDVSNMNSNLIANRLYEYLDKKENDKFKMLFQSLIADKTPAKDRKWDLDVIINKWEKDAKLNSKDKIGKLNLILKAVKNENFEITKLLIKHGAGTDCELIKPQSIESMKCVNRGKKRSAKPFKTRDELIKTSKLNYPRASQAIRYASSCNNLEMVEMFLQYGISPNEGVSKIEHLNSVFMCAIVNANVKMCELLLRYGLNINEFINDIDIFNDATPIIWCCRYGYTQMLKWLFYIDEAINGKDDLHLDLYATANDTDSLTRNALIMAVESDFTHIVLYLLEDRKFSNDRTDPDKSHLNVINYVDSEGKCALWHAARNGNATVLRSLINYCKSTIDVNIISTDNVYSCSPLHVAAMSNHFECVKCLLECSTLDVASVNRPNSKSGDTPLSAAMNNGCFDAAQALCNDKNVQILPTTTTKQNSKQKGENDDLNISNSSNNGGDSDLLLLACKSGQSRMVQLVLKTMFNRMNIALNSWEMFEKSKLLTMDRLNQLINVSIECQCRDVAMFLEQQIKEQCFKRKNFDLLKAKLDFQDNSVMTKKINTKTLQYRKDKTAATTLIETLQKNCDKNSKIFDNLATIILSMISNSSAINDVFLFVAAIIDEDSFVDCLINQANYCLQETNKSEFDKIWIKEHLLVKSNILSMQLTNSGNSNKDKKGETLLFDVLNNKVIKPAMHQNRVFLKRCIEQEEREQKEFFNLVKGHYEYNYGKNNVINQRELIGMYYDNDTLDGKQIKVEYDPKHLVTDYQTGYDSSNEYDNNSFLTQLLIWAHSGMNESFQKDLQRFFDPKRLGDGIVCEHHRAPPKTKDRSQMKASLEYYTRTWPHTSHLLDMIRGSIVFDNSKSFYNGLTKFANASYDGEPIEDKSMMIRRLVRIKNGFNAIDSWRNNVNKFSYIDIKLNVVIEWNNKTSVAEIQLLYEFLEKFKKKCHKLYNYERNEELYRGVAKGYKELHELSNDNDIKTIEMNMYNIVVTQNRSELINILLYDDLNKFVEYLKKDQTRYKFLIDYFDQNNWQVGKRLFQSFLAYAN